MPLLFHKTFVDAVTGANGFDQVSVSNGTIIQSAGAGLNGTSGGVTCTATGASPRARGDLLFAFGGTAHRTAMWVDLSGLTIGTLNHLCVIWQPRDNAAAGRVAGLRVFNLAGSLVLTCRTFPDGGGSTDTNVALTSYPAWIEIEIIPESVDGAGDGEHRFYFGGGDYDPLGELVVEHLAVDNIVGYAAIDRTRYGMETSSASVGGTLLIDEIIARNDNTPILFGVSDSTFPCLTYLRRRRRD